MNAVKVGQVWQDKDKRRGTIIEIIDTFSSDEQGEMALGIVVGTEIERTYKVEQITKRWTLQAEKPRKADKKVVAVINDIISDEAAAPTSKPKHKNRESWLEAAVKELTKLFTKIDHEVPAVRVSVGWPGGRGKKANVISQCFAAKTATDSVSQIFVSPVVVDPLKAVIVVAHEMIHAVDDCKSGHKSGFIKIARELGFTPKWTVATPDTISDEFKVKLEAIAEKLGTYPHAAIVATERPVVQKSYMLKVLCTEDSDYFVRMTATKLEEYGAPICPCHKTEMELEEK